MVRVYALIAATVIGLATTLSAQTSTGLSFGNLSIDPLAAVEMSADNLAVDQATGQAVFSGNVKIGQGDLRLGANKVVVTYSSTGGIDTLSATGDVTFVTATESAEAQSAVYSIADQSVILRTDVLLLQGQNALLADSMRVDLATGNAVMEGRVRTVIQPSGN